MVRLLILLLCLLPGTADPTADTAAADCPFCQGNEVIQCGRCGGKGERQVSRSRCNGKCKVTCLFCRGSGKWVCVACRGSGQIVWDGGDKDPCKICNP